jgi:hypothetical protein
MTMIKSIEDFLACKEQKQGYFMVVDGPTSSIKIHNVHCAWITEESFHKKVFSNKEKNGSYYWLDHWNPEHPIMNEIPCKKCME